MQKEDLQTYHFIDGDFEMDINVSIEERTIYMNQSEIAKLLNRSRNLISRRLKEFIDKNTSICSQYVQKVNISSSKCSLYYRLEIIKEIGEKYNKERIEKLEKWLEEILNKNLPVLLEDNYKIVRYSRDKISIIAKIDLEGKTAWITQEDIAVLFDVTVSTISEHIDNIYEDEELEEWATLRNFRKVQIEGNREIKRYVKHYNTDMLVAIGYRVNSKNAIIFRKWVSSIVNGFIANGYVYDKNRIELVEQNNMLLLKEIRDFKDETNDKFKTIESWIEVLNENFIDPESYKHYLIMNGQKIEADIAYQQIYSLAKHSIIIIDNYISVKTLGHLKVCKDNIDITIISDNEARNKLTEIELNDFISDTNKTIKLKKLNGLFHDRYIVIDYKMDGWLLYDSGPSIKDAGNSISTIKTIEKKELYIPLIDEVINNDDLVL